jgi:hypothetical protein
MFFIKKSLVLVSPLGYIARLSTGAIRPNRELRENRGRTHRCIRGLPKHYLKIFMVSQATG